LCEELSAQIARSPVPETDRDWLPPNLGVGQPIIKPKGIDDVPILTATTSIWSPTTPRCWSRPAR
jgi:hypothetical protein